ncbi:MAG: M56 family metallopeptidase [Daejeonella sp.]
MILYLLKVNVALVLFYGGYHLVLQRYTFHTLNRFYLLVGLLYSALYPLINLSDILSTNEDLKQKVLVLTPDWQRSMTGVMSRADDQAGSYWQIVLIVFWTGVIFMSLRLGIQLISLLRLHLQSSAFMSGEIRFRKISMPVNPFSFWRAIYVNPECHEAAELRSILEHEQVHVKQLHTFDVLLAELSTIFYWFNPGVWLMKKAIKANLEFITDQEVIQSGMDSKEYQYALLKINVLPQNSLPVNNFHFLTIKRRIAMINKKPTGRINLGGYLLLLPAIMLSVLVVSASKGGQTQIGTITPEMSKLKDLPGLTGKVLEKEQSLSAPAELTKTIEKLNSLVFESLNYTQQNSKVDTNKIIVIKSPDKDSFSAVAAGKDSILVGGPKPIYIINGVRTSKGITDIDPDSIVSVDVLKGSGAIAIYGAEGKNGVIEIRTKAAVSSTVVPKVVGITSAGTAKPAISVGYGAGQTQKISLSNIDKELIILDGKEASKSEINLLTVSSIESITIIKGTQAAVKYGEKAREGVIVITTKK